MLSATSAKEQHRLQHQGVRFFMIVGLVIVAYFTEGWPYAMSMFGIGWMCHVFGFWMDSNSRKVRERLVEYYDDGSAP